MESKGFLFTVIPLLAIIVVFGYLNIEQEKNSLGTQPPSEICNSIEYNGQDRIDILFISSLEDAKHYTEVLLNSEPYKQHRNYFNTQVIERTDIECKDYKGIAILCNTLEVQELAKQCAHDYVIVIKEEPANIRSSAYGNIMSINKFHADSVLIHEFGHAFGNLAEEYGGAKIPSGSKNCVSDCSKFNSQIDSCELECSQGNFYRSIPSGVMRTLITSNYGLYNNELIIKLLEKNKPKDSAITGMQINQDLTCNENIVPILIQDQDGQIKATSNNLLEKGCVPAEAGDGSLCIEGLCYPDVIFTDSQDMQLQETLEGETLSYEDPTLFYVIQNPIDPIVEVTLNGNLISAINTLEAGATACLI